MVPGVVWFSLSFLSFVQINYATIYRLSDEEYDLMPPIITLDRYDKCLRRPGGRYCTAYGTYVSDEFSPLLEQIQEYSLHITTHFNHTRALFGTCLTTQKCENLYSNTTTDPGRILEACLNRSVWEKYKLNVKVDEDVFCHEHNEKSIDIGAEDVAVACVVLALVLCNAIGSLLDVTGTKPDGIVTQILLCFSISRNWKKLNAPPENLTQQRFKAIHGIRAISIMLVVIAHSALPCIVLSENPKFVEDQFDILPVHILLNGTLIMQMFLFLSAFLLVYISLSSFEEQVTWKMLPVGILWRWLRLTPPYAIVLAVTATWMKYISSGPVWDNIVVTETVDCRRYWWQHLLYINNYVNSSKCMPQTWYLATDTQLYCLGLAIFVSCRSQAARRVVLPTLFIIGLAIPALHTYYQDLDGALLITPRTAIEFFRTDPTFNAVYRRGHTNIPCYIMGMAFGYLVHSLHKNNFDATKYKRWVPLYWSLFPLAVTITLACKVFYEDGPRVGLLHRVWVAALMKPVFGLALGLITVGATLKMDSWYRGVLEWGAWTVPARVSYSAYLIHVAIIRSTSGTHDRPVHSTYLRIIEVIVTATVMTFAAAVVFWLTVEAPLGRVVKICFQSGPAQKTKGTDKSVEAEKVDTKM